MGVREGCGKLIHFKASYTLLTSLFYCFNDNKVNLTDQWELIGWVEEGEIRGWVAG